MHFTDLIVEPYILLIIEYLDNPGRCICNDFQDECYNVSVVNKEMYAFITKYKKMSPVYGFKSVLNHVQEYFTLPVYCVHHHLNPNIKPSYVDKVTLGIKALLNKQNKNQNGFGINNLLWDKEMFNSEKMEFIHGKNKEEAYEIKQFIYQYTNKIYLLQNSCCSGSGFAISLNDG